MVVIKHGVRVTLEWIGEGWTGDYNPKDKEDEPLMRFCVDHKIGRHWEAVNQASYCTRVPACLPKARKIGLAKKILDAIYDSVQNPGIRSPKKISENLSWMDGEGNLR